MSQPTQQAEPTLAEAQAVLDALRNEYAALSAKISDAYETVQILLMQQTTDRLAGRTPDEFWTDPDLRAYVIDTDWSSGQGNAQASEFLRQAIRDLAPGDFFDHERILAKNYHTVLGVKPRLTLNYEQDITQARTALLRMHEVLALPADIVAEHLAHSPVDLTGALLVDIFEHTLSEGGTSYDLVVYSDERATVLSRGYETYSGTLTEALTYIAKHHWYEGGPREESCPYCGSYCAC